MNPKQYAQLKLQPPVQPIRPDPNQAFMARANSILANRPPAQMQVQNQNDMASKMQNIKQNQMVNAQPANRPSAFNQWGMRAKTN